MSPCAVGVLDRSWLPGYRLGEKVEADVRPFFLYTTCHTRGLAPQVHLCIKTCYNG
jgi:hypothetical protein